MKSPRYRLEPPGPESVREAREAAGLTQTQAADMIHATKRGWQKYEFEGEGNSRRQIPLVAWELFLLKAGLHPVLEIKRRKVE